VYSSEKFLTKTVRFISKNTMDTPRGDKLRFSESTAGHELFVEIRAQSWMKSAMNDREGYRIRMAEHKAI
jgi:hypothetical protein